MSPSCLQVPVYVFLSSRLHKQRSVFRLNCRLIRSYSTDGKQSASGGYITNCVPLRGGLCSSACVFHYPDNLDGSGVQTNTGIRHLRRCLRGPNHKERFGTKPVSLKQRWKRTMCNLLCGGGLGRAGGSRVRCRARPPGRINTQSHIDIFEKMTENRSFWWVLNSVEADGCCTGKLSGEFSHVNQNKWFSGQTMDIFRKVLSVSSLALFTNLPVSEPTETHR